MSSAVRKARQKEAASSGHPRLREVLGIVLLALGLFVGTAMLSLQFGDGHLMGPLGHWVARGVWAIAGIASYAIVAGLVVGPVRLLAGKRPLGGAVHVGGAVLGIVSLAILLHLIGGSYRVAELPAGGRLGGALAGAMKNGVGTAGTALFGAAGLFLAIVALTPLEIATCGRWLKAVAQKLGAALLLAGRELAGFCGDIIRAILPERDEESLEEEDEDDEDEVEDRPARPRRGRKVTATTFNPAAAADAPVVSGELAGDTVRVGEPDMEPIIVEPKKKRRPKTVLDAAGAAAAKAVEPASEEPVPSVVVAPEPTPVPVEAVRLEPVIVDSAFQKDSKKAMKEKEKAVAAERPDFIPLGDGVYRLPAVSLLKYDDAGVQLDKNAMLELSARLTQAMSDYGVKGEVQAIRPGPVVTMYEFAPAPGTRVAKIANLSDDLAMRLEAPAVRIVAPIPGKAVVGVEVPNKTRETVYLKEIIADDVFVKAKSKLALALGKDIEGRPVAVDLAKMPHLLVAGTTGSGKSVCVNTMITSILYNATPEEVRMIMVDPKMLELSIYEGIPHLLLPVVTDPKKANLALRWAVDEMERRYELLAEAGVRDISSYNKKIEIALAGQPVPVAEPEPAESFAEGTEPGDAAPVDLSDGEEISRQQVLKATAPRPARKLPFIVVVIDEFADLMMVAPKDIETSVARIAQKARAAGIHLILATQRPSVDVITGLIKANFPSRIAFKVVQRNDSRTVLDQNGAEALLGQGDMLFSDRGGALRRVHGCLVGDEEIHAVVDHLKKQAKPVYDMDILKPRPEDSEDGEGGEGVDPADDLSDDMYDRAVALVAETRQVSISGIQRRLRVGYNRAARMVERMEREGVVGPPDHQNRREVLVSA
jgi:S-DNA-T family DNA segregation ATPase FtsK/SpoIIIE